MGARRRCCCVCYNLFDPFPVDGEDVAAVDAYWEECTGDWVIADGMLTTEDADAVVAFKPMVGHPVGIFEAKVAIVKVEPAMNSIGGTAQMFAYVGSDGTPCGGTAGAWRAELDIINSALGELRLYDPSNNLAGTRQCVFTQAHTTFWMCVGWDTDLEWGEVVCGCDDSGGNPIWACHQGMPTYYFALGNKLAAPNQVYYEEVFYIDQYDHDSRCPDCSIPCCCPCIEQELSRPTLTATVVLTEEPDCHISGGEDTTLTCHAAEGECCAWTNADTTDLVLECEAGDHIELTVRMECAGESGYGITGHCEDYIMTVGMKNPSDPEELYCYTIASGGPGGIADVTKGVVGACHCEPALEVTFGPFYLWRNPSMLPYPPLDTQCKCCKAFNITVTE